MTKKFLSSIALALALAGVCRAEGQEQTQVIGPFGMLNTTDSPAIIASNQAQDMLNVDISPGGKSVKKRDGYSLDNSFTVSTSPIHGAYKFNDSAGNEVRLWGQDTGLFASVAGASYVKVATGTLNATWQCTDYLGFAYCVTSARDTPVKTNGTTGGTTYQGTIPAGTMVASTPERLLVAGVAAQPQRLYYSGASNFTDFTLGAFTFSSSYEDIAAPGSALTHLSYQYGRWLWWKDQSFGFIAGTDQTNLQLITVSYTIGTYDNTDVYDSGLTYFRGTDSHFYTYDGTQLSRISRDISPTVTSANRRKANSWTQTTQSDWASGAATFNGPSVSLSTAIVSGSIYPSTITIVDTSSADFSAGTAGSGIDTTTVSGAVTLKTYLFDGFSSMGNWTQACGTTNASGGEADFTSASTVFQTTVISSPTGHFITQFDFHDTDSSANGEDIQLLISTASTSGYVVSVVAKQSTNKYELYLSTAASNGTISPWLDGSGGCSSVGMFSPNSQYISSATIGNYDTATHTVKFIRDNATGSMQVYWDGVQKLSTTDNSFTTFRNASFAATQATGLGHFKIDNYYLVARQGNFTSRLFDTAYSTPIYGTFNSGTANAGTWSYAIRCSSVSNSSFTSDSAISTGSIISGCTSKRYLVYSSTISSTDPSVLPQITDVTVIAASTGTYYSAVNNAINFTSWGTFNVTDTSVGASSITYYTRASTSPFSVLSSTPAWVSQSRNTTVAASTGTYFQARADFALAFATDTPHLDDFAFNWYEGTAADKMYGIYHNYAIWFAVSLGTSTTTNNRILRFDLINQGWNMYDIAANGFLTYNTRLQFGDPSAGKTYTFGSVTSDNNSAINSYWKSKDFFGGSPFTDEDLRTMSWYCKTSSGTTLSVTYQINESSTTTYSINLFDSKSNIIRHNRNIQAGTMANVMNVKFGDNSSNLAWEVFAGQYTYLPRSWSVYP